MTIRLLTLLLLSLGVPTYGCRSTTATSEKPGQTTPPAPANTTPSSQQTTDSRPRPKPQSKAAVLTAISPEGYRKLQKAAALPPRLRPLGRVAPGRTAPRTPSAPNKSTTSDTTTAKSKATSLSPKSTDTAKTAAQESTAKVAKSATAEKKAAEATTKTKAKAIIARTKEGYVAQWNRRYFSHQLFRQLLRKHLRYGRVNYVAIRKQSMPLLKEYLYRLARTNPSRLATRSQKLAFWINAYNAYTILGVLNHYPRSKAAQRRFSVTTSVKGFWKKFRYRIGGKRYTLDQIENKIIRPTFNEPRIHFVLVCAAKGCPPLSSYPYVGYKRALNRQLDRATRRFLKTKRGLSIDEANNKVTISKLFQWYRKDFTIAPYKHELLFIAAHADSKRAAILKAKYKTLKVAYSNYSWSLNQRW